RAEFQNARRRNALPGEHILKTLSVGTAAAQHNDAQVAVFGERIERADRARSQQDKLLNECPLDFQGGMNHRTADEGTFYLKIKHLLQQLARRPGLQREVDLTMCRDKC